MLMFSDHKLKSLDIVCELMDMNFYERIRGMLSSLTSLSQCDRP
jgi:hypothetical protein